jgi:bifunctional DNA-binding transcriptional regulator/antitoxin component of YhaV-PrlF toxin-antitoxin module
VRQITPGLPASVDSKAIMPYTFQMRKEAPSLTTLTVTAKGQVTLKQDLLHHLGVSPGQQIEADRLPDGRIVVRAAGKNGSIVDFVGCLSRPGGPGLTVKEIKEIATRGWARKK